MTFSITNCYLILAPADQVPKTLAKLEVYTLFASIQKERVTVYVCGIDICNGGATSNINSALAFLNIYAWPSPINLVFSWIVKSPQVVFRFKLMPLLMML